MSVTANDLDRLLTNAESEWLEWKQDFPRGLLVERHEREWTSGRGEILKDLASLANGDGERRAYLVYGVTDLSATRRVNGISKHWDDAIFQEWSRSAFDPPIGFIYSEIELSAGRIGVFDIDRSAAYPHVAQRTIGDLHEGQVWFRRGTRNEVAHRADLIRMAKGEEPFRIASLDDPAHRALIEHYRAMGMKLQLVRFLEKDSKLVQGYSLAYYPGTRREVQLGPDVTPEFIAMLGPET